MNAPHRPRWAVLWARQRREGLRAQPSDSGQIAVLVLGYLLIAVALIMVVTAASAVHLERKRLLAVADSAALDAADAGSQEAYLAEGVRPGQGVPLTDDDVRSGVEDYLRRTRPRFEDLRVVAPTGADERAAVVTLQARVRPPFVGWVLDGWAAGLQVRVTSRAEVRLR